MSTVRTRTNRRSLRFLPVVVNGATFESGSSS